MTIPSTPPPLIISSQLSLNCEGNWGTRWFRNQLPPFSPVLHCPLGLAELQACPFPNVVFPPLLLSALSSSLFSVPCKTVLARPVEQQTWPYHCSLHLFTTVRRSSCGPTAYWILAQTSSLVTQSLLISTNNYLMEVIQMFTCIRSTKDNLSLQQELNWHT